MSPDPVPRLGGWSAPGRALGAGRGGEPGKFPPRASRAHHPTWDSLSCHLPKLDTGPGTQVLSLLLLSLLSQVRKGRLQALEKLLCPPATRMGPLWEAARIQRDTSGPGHTPVWSSLAATTAASRGPQGLLGTEQGQPARGWRARVSTGPGELVAQAAPPTSAGGRLPASHLLPPVSRCCHRGGGIRRCPCARVTDPGRWVEERLLLLPSPLAARETPRTRSCEEG